MGSNKKWVFMDERPRLEKIQGIYHVKFKNRGMSGLNRKEKKCFQQINSLIVKLNRIESDFTQTTFRPMCMVCVTVI